MPDESTARRLPSSHASLADRFDDRETDAGDELAGLVTELLAPADSAGCQAAKIGGYRPAERPLASPGRGTYADDHGTFGTGSAHGFGTSPTQR